jgi:hypothetical protein
MLCKIENVYKLTFIMAVLLVKFEERKTLTISNLWDVQCPKWEGQE